MPIETWQVGISQEDIVAHLAGSQAKDKSSNWWKEVEDCLELAQTIIEPCCCYEEFQIARDEKFGQVTLEGKGLSFQDRVIYEELAGAEGVVLLLVTVGDGLEKAGSEYFGRGDYFRGMVLDAIGSAALFKMTEEFQRKLKINYGTRGYNLTRGYSPGCNGWDLREQRIIWQGLGAEGLGITINHQGMINPLKSVTKVFGWGKGLGNVRIEAECQYCNCTRCSYGKNDGKRI